MARTTPDLVKGILLKDYNTRTNPDLTPFIDTAHAITNRLAFATTDKGLILTTTELELIERWISAHCYCLSDKPYESNKTLDAEAKYQGKTKTGLDATLYGQMALDLDWTNSLANLSQRKRVRAFWLGKQPIDQVDYYDRVD